MEHVIDAGIPVVFYLPADICVTLGADQRFNDAPKTAATPARTPFHPCYQPAFDPTQAVIFNQIAGLVGCAPESALLGSEKIPD